MKSFIRRLPFATEVPAYTSRKISTRNQVVCSFFALFPRFYIFVHVVCYHRETRSRIHYVDRNMPNTLLSLYYIHYTYNGVLTDVLFTACIYIILFSPKRRWRSTLERPVRKNCASSALRFSGGSGGVALVAVVYCKNVLTK